VQVSAKDKSVVFAQNTVERVVMNASQDLTPNGSDDEDDEIEYSSKKDSKMSSFFRLATVSPANEKRTN